jgi:hypothetical protein
MEEVFGSKDTTIAAANLEAAEHKLDETRVELSHVESKS